MNNFIKEITIDPLKQFTDEQDEKIAQACGILPVWVVNDELFDTPLREALASQYGMPMSDFDEFGATVAPDGTYKSKGDPDLSPLIKIVRGTETFYQYEYAIIAIVQEDGSTYISRMD